MVAYQDGAQNTGSSVLANGSAQDGEEEVLTFMQHSLFCTPESFDDDMLEEWVEGWEDPEILWVSGDLDDDMEFSEDESVAILANYKKILI